MTQQALTMDEIDLISPDVYAQRGYPHDTWTRLRREDPVAWFPRRDGRSFWAVTRHADITEISRQPERFRSRPLLFLGPDAEQPPENPLFPPTLIQMDPPKHGIQRSLFNKRFTPRALTRMRDSIEAIAVEILDEITTGDALGECDFVERVSAPLPIAVIAWLLGVPREDWPLLFRWTNETVGAADPEYQRAGEGRQGTVSQAQLELLQYFTKLVEKRKQDPRDDLISAFVHATVDGEALPLPEVLSWCLIIVIAGNETTRNATSGALLAMIEHPDEWERLRREPQLLKPAVEEILRWTSPLIHFCRTATEDYELRGRKIRAGDALALFYPSANRDEEIFDDPFAFRIDRQPNRHLAFGVGEHFCLGAHVARTEIEVAFRHLLRRLDHVELAGPPARLRSSLIGGVKHIPIRYRMRAAT